MKMLILTSWQLMFWLKMEDLEHSFQSSTIQKMELMLLQALKWRLGSTTTYSYIELITSNIIYLKCNLQKELINQVNKTLLKAILGTICIPAFLCFSHLNNTFDCIYLIFQQYRWKLK